MIDQPLDFLNSVFFEDLIKLIIYIFLVFFAIFALIIVRQVDLMSKTLITPVSPIVKAISIILAGVAIGLIVLMIGFL